MTDALVSERIKVPAVVDQGQVDFYVDNGYLAVPDLLSAGELDELKRDIIKLARGGYPNQTIQPVAAELSDDEVLSKILAIHQPHYVSAVMEKYTRQPRISGVLSQITGAHMAHWSGNVKCMQSMLFIKPPGYQGQSWHQDENYIPTRDRTLIGAWIAIDDAYVENGCMWVIPGSQRAGYLYPTQKHGNPDEFDTHDDMATGFDESPQIPVEVKAGSVVFFNGYLLHQSMRNRTQGQLPPRAGQPLFEQRIAAALGQDGAGSAGGARGCAPRLSGGRRRSLLLEGLRKASRGRVQAVHS